MNTKLKSILFNISPKKEDGNDIFPSYSVYEFVFNEGISDLYYGKLYFYATNSLKASELQNQIGKLISISIEITDNLHAPGKDNALRQDYNFKRTVNGIISSLKFLGKTMNVTTKTDNKPAYIYEIDFNSPFEVLKSSYSRYHEDAYGKLQNKLEKFLTEPQKIVYGEDIKSNSPISIKYELLDSNDKKQFSSLPDNVCIQIGAYSPLFALRKIITDFGLNFNILHENKDGKQTLKVYLSKGYGVHKSNGLESDYFDKGNVDKLNYDAEIVCDQSDSGSPKLTSFSIDVDPDNLEILNNNTDFLIHSTTTDKFALTSQSNAKAESLKNLENKIAREKMKYKLNASHLVFVPGSVINAKNYLDSDVKLIVDTVSLHVYAATNTKKFNTNEQIEPSIEETICAYELDQNREPGSFTDFVKGEDNPVKKQEETAVYATQNNIMVLEAIVSDGDGQYTGEWDSPKDDASVKEPRAGSICICAGDNTENPSMFYALPSGQDKPVQVRLTSTVANSEIFNIPRIGQKVLLLSGNNNYYLHSFLSTKDSTITTETNRVKRNNALATIKGFASHSHGGRVHVWNANDKTQNVGLKGYNSDESKYKLSDIILEKNTDLNEYIKNKILDGTESSIVEALVVEDNTYAYYQDYSGTSTIKGDYLDSISTDDCKELNETSIKNRCAAIRKLVEKTNKEKKDIEAKTDKIKKDINQKSHDKEIANTAILSLTGEEKEKKQKEIDSLTEEINKLSQELNSDSIKEINDKYDKAIKGLNAVTKEFVGEIGIPNYFADTITDVFKIDHEGNLEINCPKGTVTINAQNIKMSSSKATSVTGSGSITLASTGSIKMGCAGSSISIASSAIKACTIPFSNGSLASFGSTLSMDAFEGTSIKGPTVDVSGKFSASMKDGVGAGFKVSKGVSGVSGTEASLASNDLISANLSLFKFDQDFVKEFANTITVNTDPDASKYEKGILEGVLFPLLNEGMGFYYQTKAGQNIFQKEIKSKKDYSDSKENVKTKSDARDAVYNNKSSSDEDKKNADDALEEAKKADKRTVARFVVDTCDFLCGVLDLTSKAMNVITEISKMADEDNWFERKGHVGKSNAQDIKYVFASLKYTLNTVAIHAVVVANTWGVKPAKVAIKGGAVDISSTVEKDAIFTKIDARA